MANSVYKPPAYFAGRRAGEGKVRNFELTIDEPVNLGGKDTGMSPVEALLCSLGACQAIVARVYASKFDVDLQHFWVKLEGDLDLDGFFDKADVRPGF